MCRRGDIYATDLPKPDALEVGSKFDTLKKFCDEEVKAVECIAFKQLTRNINRESCIVGMRFIKEDPDIIALW